MIKAVIFDCFGVLTEDGWLAFQDKYGTTENMEVLSYLNYQSDTGQITYKQFLLSVCKSTGVNKEDARRIISAAYHPNELLFEYIRTLKNSGYLLGIISNANSELTNYLPKEVLDLFDEITLSYQVHAVKPEPRIYQSHLEKLNLSAEQTIFIDDRDDNCVGARAVGIQSVQYLNFYQFQEDLDEAGITIT